jgi:hypothetical protein
LVLIPSSVPTSNLLNQFHIFNSVRMSPQFILYVFTYLTISPPFIKCLTHENKKWIIASCSLTFDGEENNTSSCIIADYIRSDFSTEDKSDDQWRHDCLIDLLKPIGCVHQQI